MPSIQLVEVSSQIEAPIENVWSVLSAFSAIKAWIPSIDSCTSTGNSVGSVRRVGWGANITEETLDVCDPIEHKISYTFTDGPALPLRKAYGKIILTSLGDHATEIVWTAGAAAYASGAGEVEKNFVKVVLNRFVETSVESLKVAMKPASIQLM